MMLRIGWKQLVFRKYESRLNRDFWRGCALACLIHAALFFSLRLALPPNLETILPNLPIVVESEISVSTPILVTSPKYLSRQLPTLSSAHDYLLTLPCLQIPNTLSFCEMDSKKSLEMFYEPLPCLMPEEWDD